MLNDGNMSLEMEAYRSHCTLLAQDVEWLLAENWDEPGLDVHDGYKSLAEKEGYITNRGTLDAVKLSRTIRGHFGDDYLFTLECEIEDDHNNWATRLVTQPKHPTHPLHHLLFLQSMDSSIEWFLKQQLPRIGQGTVGASGVGGVIAGLSWFNQGKRMAAPLAKAGEDRRYVDFEARDRRLEKAVLKAGEDLLLREKPVRVTKEAIGGKIGELSKLAGDLDRLPRTKAALEQICESTEAYQIRRVHRAKKRLLESGKEIGFRRLERAAGLHNVAYSDAVKTEMERLCACIRAPSKKRIKVKTPKD